MRMKHVLSVGFGALALGLVATSAQAAPVGGLGGAVDSSVTTDAGLVEKVTWYGRHYGHKPYYYGHYGYGYGYGYRPYYYGHYGYKPRFYGHYGYHKPYGRYGYGGYYRRGY
jgi:subtilase family serine protease